jgi:hypothetical protein
MIHHVFSIAVKSTAIDPKTNNLDLFNVFSEVIWCPPPVPAITHPPMLLPFPCTVVTVWYNDGTSDEEIKQRLALLGPDGGQSGPYDTPIVVPAGKMQSLLANSPQLPFHGEGCYWHLISLLRGDSWQTVARLPFTLKVANKASAASRSIFLQPLTQVLVKVFGLLRK